MDIIAAARIGATGNRAMVATRWVESKKRRNLRGSGQRTVSTTKYHTLPLNVIRFPAHHHRSRHGRDWSDFSRPIYRTGALVMQCV